MLVAVEDSDGSYVYEPRLRVQKLQLACDGDMSHALVDVYTGEIFETQYHVDDAEIGPAEMLSGQARTGGYGMVGPDQGIIVYIPDESDSGKRIVFHGYADFPQYAKRSSMQGSQQGGSIVVKSVMERLAKRQWAQIDGRYVRTSASQDSWRSAYAANASAKTSPLGTDDDVAKVSRPCTFNARGEANRAPAPIMVTWNGKPQRLYVFTDDDDRDAEPWTWAQALRYLAFFHGLGDLIDYTNIFEQTSDYIDTGRASRPLVGVYEDAGYDGGPETESQLLKFALLDTPHDACFDGENVVDAFTALAAATATHWRIQTGNSSSEPSLPQNSLIVWARGGGPRREVAEDWAATDRETKTVAEITQDLNVNQYQIGADYGDIVTNVIGHGDVRRYEITTELVPGWKPDANVDVPADVDAAVDASTAHGENLDPDDTWCQKYHTSGALFHNYADVGRRWVLNETGRYLASLYARSSGHFASSAYTPWEPSSCSITDTRIADDMSTDTVAVASGEWSRLPRPLKECFSADSSGRSYGVVVEASFDGGINWERIACKVLSTEAGVYIEADDLSRMKTVYEDGTTWWEALCNDNARVRVTGVIEGDATISANIEADWSLPITHKAARLFKWADKIKSNRRSGGNSQFAPGAAKAAPGQTTDARDDLEVLRDWVWTLLDVLTARQVPASFQVPWLEFTRYWVGDCITHLRGHSLSLEGAPSGGLRRPPDIVSLIYTPASTQIVLEDPSVADLAGLGISG
jgi:hypothetical protein